MVEFIMSLINIVGLIMSDLLIASITLHIADKFTKNEIVQISVAGALLLLSNIVMLTQNDLNENIKKSAVVINIILVIIVVAVEIRNKKQQLNKEKEKQHHIITENDLKNNNK